LNEIEEDDDFSFFVKRFNKFLGNKGNQTRINFNSKKRGEDSSFFPKFYECNQPGHLRVDCLSFKRRMKKSDWKTFKDKKAKKTYITWEDNDMDSSGDSENEIVNLSLMAKNYESEEDDFLKKSWYIDSGWSKHITGDASKFTHISPKNSGHVTTTKVKFLELEK